MLKKLTIFILSLLISVTVCGQQLRPKRIVFEKDTGVFFTSAQETQLLVKLKQLEGCKSELAYCKEYAINADIQIQKEQAAYDSLYRKFHELQIVANELQEKYRLEFDAHNKTKELLVTENTRKKNWRTAALISGVIAVFEIALLTR